MPAAGERKDSRFPQPGSLGWKPVYLLYLVILLYLAGQVYLLNQGGETPIPVEHPLSFRVYDTDPATSARGSYRGRLDGVITPRLEWRVRRVDHVSRA